MRRRALVGAVGAGLIAWIALFHEEIVDHFSVETPIPIEIFNEGTETYRVVLEAYAVGTDRQTYDESLYIETGPRTVPGHLRGSEQSLSVSRPEADLEERVTVPGDAGFVIVTLHPDDIAISVEDGRGSDRTGPPDPDGTSDAGA